MKRRGWIKLHRSFLDWEHFHNRNVRDLFLYLLLSASYEDSTYKGVKLSRGDVFFSTYQAVKDLNIPRTQIRTALEILKKSNEIKIAKTFPKGQIIKIQKFNEYQGDNSDSLQNNLQNSLQNNLQNDLQNNLQNDDIIKSNSESYEPKSKNNSLQNSLQNDLQNDLQNSPQNSLPNIKNIKKNKKIKNINNNLHSGCATSSDSIESDVNEIIKNLSNSLRVQSGEEKKRKVAQKEKKRTFIATAHKKPIAPENRYHNAAIEFWTMLKPIYGNDYIFKTAILEKWMADLKLIEKTHGYSLEEVFDLLKWAIKNDDNSITYIQSPHYFAKERSKNLTMLRKKKEFWEKDIRRRNGEVVTKISGIKNLIVADR